MLAAAGMQALDDFENGMLVKDHDRALYLAFRLADLPGLTVDVETVNTNIVLVSTSCSFTRPGLIHRPRKGPS